MLKKFIQGLFLLGVVLSTHLSASAADVCEFQGIRFAPSLKDFLAQFPTGSVTSTPGDQASGFQISQDDFQDNSVFDDMTIYSKNDFLRQVKLDFIAPHTETRLEHGKLVVETINDGMSHSEIMRVLQAHYGEPYARLDFCEEAIKRYQIEWRMQNCRVVYEYAGTCPATAGETLPVGTLYMESLPLIRDNLTQHELILVR